MFYDRVKGRGLHNRLKVDPALIACFRPAMVGCFWPIFFFADHRSGPRVQSRNNNDDGQVRVKRPRVIDLPRTDPLVLQVAGLPCGPLGPLPGLLRFVRALVDRGVDDACEPEQGVAREWTAAHQTP